MYCTQCGGRNPDSARFCGNCGASLTAARPTSEPARYVERPRASAKPGRGAWPFLVMVALVLLVVGAAWAVWALRGGSGMAKAPETGLPGASGLVQAQGPAGGPPVTQMGNVPSFEPQLTQSPPGPAIEPGVTQAPQTPSTEPGVTQTPPPPERPRVPPGTNDYLEWLRRKELERQRMYGEMQHAIQMAAMQAGVDWAESMRELMEPGGLDTLDEGGQGATSQMRILDEQVAKLDALSGEFANKVPPDSCRALHEQYSAMLGKWAGYMKKVQRAIADMSFVDLPPGGGADRNVEDAIARTEHELGAVYERYQITDPPRFHIEDKGAPVGSPFTAGG